MRFSLPFKLPTVSPIARITIGLVSLSLSMIIGFDVVFGLFPRETETARLIRLRISQSLAVQATQAVQTREFLNTDRVFEAIIAKDPDLESAGLRRGDGTLFMTAGPHKEKWKSPGDGRSTLEHVIVPINDEGKRWGSLELSFRPPGARTMTDWILSPPMKLFGIFLVMGSIVYYLYLRRVLQRLDPSSAVPDRVRVAFDSLSEGVLIVDANTRVMLANQSLYTASASVPNDVLGKTPEQLTWLRPSHGDRVDATPWKTAMRERRPVLGTPLEVTPLNGERRKLIVNCAPVMDGKRTVRGCMLTFSDVTELERANDAMMEVLADLASNKEALESKNIELERLASRDPMTGCLNRRVFFERYENIYAEAKRKKTDVACIMADIDKFKLINDTWGHQTGDEVIKAFAAILQTMVRGADLVGRYGGEEFCIVLVGADIETANRLAERIRKVVELECGRTITKVPNLRVTASLGVSSVKLGSSSANVMVNEADQALYHAKQSGRNRVADYRMMAEAVV